MSIVLALCMSFSMALGAVAFAENGEKTVLSIQISKQPDKLIYFDGQTITLNGIELIINYSDGTSRSVTTDEIIADRLSYDVTHTTMSFDGVNSPVQIEYGSVLSEPLNIIIIKDVQYVKISDASRANLKNAYIVGENFDLSGMQLEVKWKVKDTKTQNVTETVEIIPREQFSSIGISVTPQHGAKLTAGTHDLIAAYPGSNTVELEFPITFTDVSTLSVTEQPVKTAYKYGETLDLTGLQVRLDLLNGSTKVVDFSEFDKYGITVFPAHGTVLTHATNQIMITHGQISIEHNITVTPVVTGILYGSAVWVYYDRANPTLNLSKLNVKLTKSDGSTQTVPFSEFESHGITTEPAHGTPLPEPKYGKAYQLEVAYPVPGGSSLRYTGNVYAFQKAVQNIRVKTEPSQIANPAKSIEQKDVLDLSGLEVELIWNDGSPNTTVNLAQFNDYGLTVSPADGTLLNTIGTNTVTVSHTYTKDGTSETETAKDSFTFPVQGVTSLEWYAESAKKEYTAGE
ncbi:MAG: hypothetical protein ACOYI3_01160, partial [Christensenellales bacterium]